MLFKRILEANRYPKSYSLNTKEYLLESNYLVKVIMRIIYSEDYGLIRLKLHSLTKGFDEEDIIKLSFLENSWNQIRAALTNMNFQAKQKKLIILEDAIFLSKNSSKVEPDFNLEQF